MAGNMGKEARPPNSPVGTAICAPGASATHWRATHVNWFTRRGWHKRYRRRHARACAPILSVGSGAHSHDHTGDCTRGRDLGAVPRRMSWPPALPPPGYDLTGRRVVFASNSRRKFFENVRPYRGLNASRARRLFPIGATPRRFVSSGQARWRRPLLGGRGHLGRSRACPVCCEDDVFKIGIESCW